MAFLHWENHKNHSILLKTTFEIPLFPTNKVCEHTATFDYTLFLKKAELLKGAPD